MPMYIIFDIGGTKTRIAGSDDGENFSEPVIYDTPKDFDDGISCLKEKAFEIAGEKKITAMGGGIAGPLDRSRSKLVNSPHLPGWVGKPVADELALQTQVPVYIENDTAIVGLGEAVHGAGKNYSIVVYITVSTGVGGVRIVNKRIDVSAMGFEPGHQIIDAGGGLAVLGEPPYHSRTLESYVSGSSVEARYHKKPYEILEPEFWERMARFLAYGINNSIVHWSPDAVVIGGSMMKKIGIPIDRVSAHLKGILHIYPTLPAIVKAELGDIGGLHGALYYVKTMNKNSA